MTGESQDGVGYYQLTQRNARRSSAAMAYLAPNRGRPNLTVRTGAQVRRIVVENGRATGVEMIDGSRITASAEVILSVRRDRVAAAADAVGHRSGGSPGRGRRSGRSSTSPGRVQLPGPPGPLRDLRGDRPAFLRPLRQAPLVGGRGAAVPADRSAARSPRASSRPAASGTPTRTRARPTSSSIWASAPGSKPASRRCRTAGSRSTRLPAPPVARHRPAGQRRSGGAAADRPELLGGRRTTGEMSIAG